MAVGRAGYIPSPESVFDMCQCDVSREMGRVGEETLYI